MAERSAEKPRRSMIQQLSQSKERSCEQVFRTRSSRSFTTKLSQHGMYQNTTLDAATRSKQEHDRSRQLREKRMARLEAEFEEETKKVMKLQDSIQQKHAELASVALRKHGVLCIQAVYRGHQGRLQVKKTKSAAKICAWLYSIFVARLRKQQARMCCRFVVRKAVATVLQEEMSLYRASVIVQKVHRMASQHRKYKKDLAIHKATQAVCSHVLLYGTQKAAWRLSKHLRLQRALYRLLQYYVRMRRLKRLRNMHHISFFDHLSNMSPDVFEFVKSRAIAMESSNCNISSVINTPRTTFAAVKTKAHSNVSFGVRRGQLQVPKRPELKYSLSPWNPTKDGVFPPELFGTYRLKRVEEAVTLLYDLIMVARNNLLNIISTEEYDQLVEKGLLKSSSSSSLASDLSGCSRSHSPTPGFCFIRRKEISSGGSVGSLAIDSTHLTAGTPRPNQPGIPGMKTVQYGRSSHSGKRKSQLGHQALHIITDIPEHEKRAVSSGSDEESLPEVGQDHSSKVSTCPDAPLSSVRGKKNMGRNFNVPPTPKKNSVSRAPPPGTKPSFQKPTSNGRKLVESKRK